MECGERPPVPFSGVGSFTRRDSPKDGETYTSALGLSVAPFCPPQAKRSLMAEGRSAAFDSRAAIL